MLASGLIENGMNWWQAILTFSSPNVIVLIRWFWNAHAGVKIWDSVPRLLPRQLRHERRERARHGAGDGRLRVVRHSMLDRRSGAAGDRCIFTGTG